MAGRFAMLLALGLATAAPRTTRLLSGDVPAAPRATVGGGLVLLDVRVGENGSVDSVRALQETPPFTEPLREAVRGWRFEAGEGVAHVLVAALYRPPALLYAGGAAHPRRRRPRLPASPSRRRSCRRRIRPGPRVTRRFWWRRGSGKTGR